MTTGSNIEQARIGQGTTGKSNNYERGLELAESGQHEQALICIQEHLRFNPNDVEALNDVGAILHCLGRSDEAIRHIVRARGLRGDSAEIIWNLAEAYLGAGKAAEIIKLCVQMNQMEILSADLLNRTANVFLEQGNKSQAVECLLWSLELAPQQEVLNRMIEVIQMKRPKIAFFCGLPGDTKFLGDIYDFSRYRYLVQLPEVNDVNQMYETMKTSDISWFEWCTDVVVEASKLQKVCKNIVRLHRFEAYNEWPGRVKWENIDILILVGNSFVREALLKQVPDIESRTRVVTVPNGVNLDKFKFVDRRRGKNLACIGYLNMRKNPMLLLGCMQKLHYIDRDYKLFFAGDFQDSMLEQYVRHMVEVMGLQDVVFFDGWQSDVNSWLEDKHFIVSGSIGESQGMGLLEGMACGLKPVIHNFPGASEIFPEDCLFNIAEEFCDEITSKDYDSSKYRAFVEERYPLSSQLKKINQLFGQLETEIDAESVGNSSVSEPVQTSVARV